MAPKLLRRIRRKGRRSNARANGSAGYDGDDLNKKKNPNQQDDHTDDDTVCSMTEGEGMSSTAEDNPNELLHEVMGDNLDLMLEIILQIREDEDYAKTVYQDCPRLQHLLDQNPDLRPIFEDPLLVRINFEQVYQKAGGVLPEDEPSKFKKVIKCIVTHPLFKVFRFLLLLKKLYNCIMGGEYYSSSSSNSS